jgi:hypothetical protein
MALILDEGWRSHPKRLPDCEVTVLATRDEGLERTVYIRRSPRFEMLGDPSAFQPPLDTMGQVVAGEDPADFPPLGLASCGPHDARAQS